MTVRTITRHHVDVLIPDEIMGALPSSAADSELRQQVSAATDGALHAEFDHSRGLEVHAEFDNRREAEACDHRLYKIVEVWRHKIHTDEF